MPTTPPHHLVPFLPCPYAIPKPPPSTAHIHLNPSLFCITPRNSRLPRPCNHTVDSMCRSKRVSHTGGNFDTTRVRPQYTHHRLDLHPQICRRLSPQLTLCPLSAPPRGSYLWIQPTQTAPTLTCTCRISNSRRFSLTIAHARQPSADLGLDGNVDDDGVREPGYGWPAAI